MNVEIATEAALLPEKKYINGIFVAVQESDSVTDGWPNPDIDYEILVRPMSSSTTSTSANQ
jgi:hypothetical protein